jgi:hypothetical protein
MFKMGLRYKPCYYTAVNGTVHSSNRCFLNCSWISMNSMDGYSHQQQRLGKHSYPSKNSQSTFSELLYVAITENKDKMKYFLTSFRTAVTFHQEFLMHFFQIFVLRKLQHAKKIQVCISSQKNDIKLDLFYICRN